MYILFVRTQTVMHIILINIGHWESTLFEKKLNWDIFFIHTSAGWDDLIGEPIPYIGTTYIIRMWCLHILYLGVPVEATHIITKYGST